MHGECSHAYRAFNEDAELITMACDSWNCPECSKGLAWRWAERVRYGIALSKSTDAYFWTLTLPAWVRYPKTGFRILPDVWGRLRRTMQSTFEQWPYAAFVECHPHRDLIPHFHIISLVSCPGRLKDVAVEAGFGHQAWNVQITSAQAAGYVTKYTSKQGYVMPRHFRRVRIAQCWPKLPSPLYDHIVYPRKNHEKVEAYLRRIAGLTGEDYNLILSRWTS